MTDYGWRFGDYPGASGTDPELGAGYLHEIYTHARTIRPRNRADSFGIQKSKRLLTNESSEIVKILNSAFDDLLDEQSVNLYPQHLQEEIDILPPTFSPP